ncbi:hypothetical protein [Microbispora rosea]|uniref:hypothetical protein n=1 Tax=Microbispora rosea TaxID=58117 RepID=UPI003D8E85F6
MSKARGAGIASFVGTSIEWYDFYIYGTASALVFGKLFFPEASPTAGVMASFATFWVGFLARPGLALSIVFGGASYAGLAGFLTEVLGWTRTWTGSPPMPSSTSAGRRWCRGSTTPTTT